MKFLELLVAHQEIGGPDEVVDYDRIRKRAIAAAAVFGIDPKGAARQSDLRGRPSP